MKSALLLFRIGSYVNVFNWNGHLAIYLRQFYADKGLRVQQYTQNMAIFGDFDQTEAYFLAPYNQYMLQQCQTWFYSSPRMCHWWKNQFEHGEVGITWSINPLFAKTHKLLFCIFAFLMMMNEGRYVESPSHNHHKAANLINAIIDKVSTMSQ
jgi:hypothetical protein